MDKRIEKTEHAIFQAFEKLLSEKKYSKITIQEIIDKAGIGRSTFYSHYQTKEQLLNGMCKEIFEHVFSNQAVHELTHNFQNKKDMKSRLTHLLCHLQENEKYLKTVFISDSGDIFIKYFRTYLEKFFDNMFTISPNSGVPQDYIYYYLTSSLIDTIRWWVNSNMASSPESVASYYMFAVKDLVIEKTEN